MSALGSATMCGRQESGGCAEAGRDYALAPAAEAAGEPGDSESST